MRTSPRPQPRPHRQRAQRGFTLIELTMFIVIVGVAIAGILVVYNQTVRNSADPMVRKQALALAESLMAEVLSQPITYCDPQDDTANDPDNPPASTADCTGGAAASQDKAGGTLGPTPATETRLSASDPFDNVADYNGLTLSPITGLDGASNSALSAYSASVSVSRVGASFGIAADAALQVDVTVSGKGENITLTSVKFRHSPQGS
jgi:MSHA pilin protein MshD